MYNVGTYQPEKKQYLLDLYPGAAAAYSLRKLSSTYSGPAIRVRRSSDNNEQDIGFVGNELDTVSLLSFVSAEDGFVKTWYDQSGNGYDFTQATPANQPQIVSSGSLIIENSKPSIDFLTSSGTYLDTPIFSLISQPTTTFAVVRDKSTASSFRVIHAGTTSNKIDFGANNGDNLYGFATKLGVSNINIDNIQASVYFLANGASSQFAKNGGSVSTRDIGSALTQVESLRIGDSENLNADWDGVMQEIIFYSSDQSLNRTAIESNINSYYNIY